MNPQDNIPPTPPTADGPPPQVFGPTQPQTITPGQPAGGVPQPFPTPQSTPSMPATPQTPGAFQPQPAGTNNSSKGKLFKILIALAAVLVLAGIIFGALALTHKSGKKNSSTSSSSNQTKTGQSVVAKYLDDFAIVCNGGTVSNAAAYTGSPPHPIALLEATDTLSPDNYTEGTTAGSMPSGWVPLDNVPSAQLAGCLKISSKASSPSLTCKMQDSSNQTLNVPYYSDTYKLSVYEAKTGKLLGAASVPGPASKCPYFASFDPKNPQIFGTPDPGSVQQALTKYVTSQ